jgi:transcriptional regulator with XRE-family HTH domain
MTSAALSFTEQNYREVALQRGPHQKLGCVAESSSSLHRYNPRALPSVAKETRPEGVAMSYGNISNTLGEKIRSALVRRMFPNTNLTRKQVLHALDISAGTLNNLQSGERDPSGPTLQKLIDFFGASFLHEVFGGPNIIVIDPREGRKSDALRKMAEAHEELRRLG